MEFEWDELKAALNLTRHGVSFSESTTVFDDPLFIEFFDPDHSDDEDRFLMIGMSSTLRLLVVAYTERDDKIRLISAREATRNETIAYEEDERNDG